MIIRGEATFVLPVFKYSGQTYFCSMETTPAKPDPLKIQISCSIVELFRDCKAQDFITIPATDPLLDEIRKKLAEDLIRFQEVICDPVCGTSGFLVASGEYLKEKKM